MNADRSVPSAEREKRPREGNPMTSMCAALCPACAVLRGRALGSPQHALRPPTLLAQLLSSLAWETPARAQGCPLVTAPTPISPASRPAQNHLHVEETAPPAILSGQPHWPQTAAGRELRFPVRRHYPQRCAGHGSPSLSLCRLVLTSSAHTPHEAGTGSRGSAGEHRYC